MIFGDETEYQGIKGQVVVEEWGEIVGGGSPAIERANGGAVNCLGGILKRMESSAFFRSLLRVKANLSSYRYLQIFPGNSFSSSYLYCK